jgi:hypothetical protein
MIEILDPTAPPPGDRIAPPAPVDTLDGVVVAVLTNRWKSMDLIAERFAERLPARYRAAEVLVETIPIASAAPVSLLDSVAARARVAVVGLAN